MMMMTSYDGPGYNGSYLDHHHQQQSYAWQQFASGLSGYHQKLHQHHQQLQQQQQQQFEHQSLPSTQQHAVDVSAQQYYGKFSRLATV